ncbi:hypothetical protein [Allocoleopsis sp.]|uniref:hypothetical protein n=1 Tax=Allocoleopsis sp. TaxID=3088169 RepID=UPI002FD58DF6
MLKLLKLSAALSAAAVIVSFPQAVLSRPLSEASGSPAVQKSGKGSPFCYMRTQQGATLNLENLCRADDGSGSGNRATNAAPNPAATNPGATTPTANTTPNSRTFTFTGSPTRDVAPNRTNTGANTNANRTNTSTNASGANNNANTNANGTNTGTNTNANGVNNNANTNANGANTRTNTNANGANNNANTNANSTNTGANNQR